MEDLDLLVLRTLRDWRSNGRHAVLVTVIRTWGSSPRPIGSIMALSDDGLLVGSVSGGCIEDDLVSKYRDIYRQKITCKQALLAPTVRVKYGISADDAHKFGLPCGGTLELLLEHDPDACLLGQIVDGLDAGKLMKRTVYLGSGEVVHKVTNAPSELVIDATQMTNTFGPGYRMLLIGGGQLTEYLATMALFNGFSVTVCDPRVEYRSTFNVPSVRVVDSMPDDTVVEFKPDGRSCVIALTHDPKLDDLALLEALDTNAFYIGAIGSRRNSQARRDRMMEHFQKTEKSLARLRGPIGVFIGSKTPSEIAVSVMAEILAIKNGVAVSSVISVGEAKEKLAIQSVGNEETTCFSTEVFDKAASA